MFNDITEAVAIKVLSTVDAGLVHGLGEPEPGKMCVEAAVNYALGAPHGDQPVCVSPALRSLKIRLNDSRWSSVKARTAGLRRLAIAQLGSAGVLDEIEFAQRVARLAIQKYLPQGLRAAAKIAKGEWQVKLLRAAQQCESDPTRANAERARKADADAYAADAADAYAADAYAAYAYAAYAAADAYAYAAYATDVGRGAAAARDKSLTAFCEDVVQILIDMKAPGCKWLYLTE